MSWVSAIPALGGLVDKALDRLLPDRKRVCEGQLELNKLELQDAPKSYLRLWRSFLFWVFTLCIFYIIVVQPVLLFYWPDMELPPLGIDCSDLIHLLMIGLGAGG